MTHGVMCPPSFTFSPVLWRDHAALFFCRQTGWCPPQPRVTYYPYLYPLSMNVDRQSSAGHACIWSVFLPAPLPLAATKPRCKSINSLLPPHENYDNDGHHSCCTHQAVPLPSPSPEVQS